MTNALVLALGVLTLATLIWAQVRIHRLQLQVRSHDGYRTTLERLARDLTDLSAEYTRDFGRTHIEYAQLFNSLVEEQVRGMLLRGKVDQARFQVRDLARQIADLHATVNHTALAIAYTALDLANLHPHQPLLSRGWAPDLFGMALDFEEPADRAQAVQRFTAEMEPPTTGVLFAG